MKKKKLSLKGLEVKSFVTNLDDNLSNTVKGGSQAICSEDVTALTGCSEDSIIGDCKASYDSQCLCDNSIDKCRPTYKYGCTQAEGCSNFAV